MTNSTVEAVPFILSQGAGYGVLIGVAALFALGIIGATKAMDKYLNENSQSTEMFMVANRSVGIGLTASAVFSSWMWASEYLWCVTMVYNYGIASAYWYAAGLSVHICVMAVVGIESKKKIANGHTCLEIIKLRYGKPGHILYLFLCLVNNLLSCSSMILATAGAITALTNIHIVASTMLIPFGVILYTAVGGLKSTFLTDYVHTFIAVILLCYFSTAVLASDKINGLSGLYDLVMKHDGDRYIDGNYQGSVMTFKSKGAIIFGIIHSVGDFGLTVMDSSFWQKTFSASVKATVPGYIIGAVCIFAVVWPLGTVCGLASIVVEDLPIFPTYPRQMTASEISSGYVLPYTLKALLGNGACGGLLLGLFLACTSTVSAQMISVSSIMSFDIYRTYIKPEATNKQLIAVSHFGVVFFGLFSAGFSVMLHYVGVDMTWMGYFYSMLICPGVVPLVLAIVWDGQTEAAALISPIVGLVLGLATWLGTAHGFYGEITIVSTGEQLPCLYGGLVAIFVPAILTFVISFIKPSKFDWSKLQEAKLVQKEEEEEDKADRQTDFVVFSEVSEKERKEVATGNIKAVDSYEDEDSNHQNNSDISHDLSEEEKNLKLINYWMKIAYGFTVFVLLLTWVVWPLPLYRNWIWNKAFFEGWTTVSIFWIYMTFIAVGLFPLWDGRRSLAKVFKGVYGSLVRH